MKTTEFRIGNLLIDAKGRLCEVYNLDYREGINAHAIEGAITSLPVKTIPITKKWLLKFGFEDLEDDWFGVNVKRGVFAIMKFRDEYLYVSGIGTEIKYVHQLQNLYFALTGEELTLKQ